MNYIDLPNCKISLSEVSLGTHTFSGDCWGKPDDAMSVRTIRAALDAGVNLFDTAHSYGLGHAEEVLGNALRGQRDKVFICTKVGTAWDSSGNRRSDFSYGSIIRSAEQCLKRLKTDYLDFYLLHFPDPETAIQESMRAMTDLVTKGMVRFIGVSRFGLNHLKEAAKFGKISVVQYPLSILDRQFGTQPGYDEIHPTKPVLEFCAQQGIGVMAYGALAKGLLAGRLNKTEMISKEDWRSRATRFQKGEAEKWIAFREELSPIAEENGLSIPQLAISWTLSQSGVATSIAGARNPEQIIENTGAAGQRLSDSDLRNIERIMEKAGHCPDFHCE